MCRLHLYQKRILKIMFFRRKSSGAEWIVVFLGNPGPKYNGTRHNVGFMVADVLAKDMGLRIDRLRFKAYTGQGEIAESKVFFMKPQTYMNLSGEAVQPAAAFYKIPPERILVVSDDVSMPVGKLRIRAKGSAGGHNGLKSIISRLGTDEFPRLKIGVGAPEHSEHELADWVLGTFRNQEAETMREVISCASKAVETIIGEGIDTAMSRFN